MGFAGRDAAVGDVHHAIKNGEKRIYIVGNEQDGDALRAYDIIDELHEIRLTAYIEISEWFIEQKQIGLPHQCLCKENALELTTGESAERAVSQFFCTYNFKCGERFCFCIGRNSDTPFVAVDPKAHQFKGFYVRFAVYLVALRHIPDARIAARGAFPQDRDAAL